jgi:tRNA dimethylallyltransferase
MTGVRESDAPVLIVTGTTASGKGDVAASLAAKLSGEVLSLDSMKVYRGMDIGTSKPTAVERRGVPHHLIDVLDPRESMNLARFVALAHETRADVVARGRVPVAVGGTMMYLHGFRHGVFAGPVADLELRESLREEARVVGVPKLHARLAAVDPLAASRIHPNDYKRIERALEVHAATGEPISRLQKETQAPAFARQVYVLSFRRDVLDARIDRRVLAMFETGFVAEVREILDSGGFGRESGEGLGYREVVEHLQGRLSLEETIALIQRRTRRFARRQLTWLKRLEAQSRFELASEAELPTAERAIFEAYEAARRRPA